MLTETRSTLLDRLAGMKELLRTWQLQEYISDPEYVSNLDKRIQMLEIDLKGWVE